MRKMRPRDGEYLASVYSASCDGMSPLCRYLISLFSGFLPTLTLYYVILVCTDLSKLLSNYREEIK